MTEKQEVEEEIMQTKERLLKKIKDELFCFYLAQLWNENHTEWGYFIEQFEWVSFIGQFNNIKWKENEKNRQIVEKIAKLFNQTGGN